MRSNLGDKIRLQHILDAIQEIESYIIDIDFDKFMENSMMRYACIKQMEIIGEASNHLSEEVKSEFTSVEWGQIVGMRNIFVHEYFGVDATIVWEIIKGDIPDLKDKIVEIIQSLE
jgi:uncharacterized protein with HEPN domain